MSNKKARKKEVKTYVLDTNILLDDPFAIDNFDGCNIILPYIVLEEIDKNKDRDDAVGANARAISRKIASYADKEEKLGHGVKIENGSVLYVLTISDINEFKTSASDDALDYLDEKVKSIYEMDFGDRKKGDNLILEFLLRLRSTDEFKGAILVSRDIMLRCKSNIFEVPAEDYRKDAAIKKDEDGYTGRKNIVVPDYVYSHIINEVNRDCSKTEKTRPVLILDEEYIGEHLGEDFVERNEIQPNQYVFFVYGEEDANVEPGVLRYDFDDKAFYKLRVPKIHNYTPKTIEHQIAVDMLVNPKIALCTLTGISGCGKSLAALAAGVAQTDLSSMFKGNSGGRTMPKDGRYDCIVVTKPTQAVGKDIGYLPGSKEEKMGPWIAPITDNLRVLLSKAGPTSRKEEEIERLLNGYFDSGVIEIEAITYMRGRSIRNAYIIIEEAQNCSVHELKTIITRAGENSKIVLTGDLDQIDALHVNAYTSGLTNVIEKFKGSKIASHLTMKNGIRSELATEAAKIL